MAVSSAGSARSNVTRRPVLVMPNVSPEVTPAPGAGTGAGGGGGGGGAGCCGAGGGGESSPAPPPPQAARIENMEEASRLRPARFVVMGFLLVYEIGKIGRAHVWTPVTL